MKPSFKKGYSLVEAVIYTAILASLTIFVSNTVLLSFSALKNAKANRRTALSAETALERIIREGRMASSVNDASSVLGSDPAVLVLNSVVSATNNTPSSKSFFISEGRLAFRQDGGEIKFLTAPKISVSSFRVSKIESVHSQAVKINLALKPTDDALANERNFYLSAVLRGGY